MRFRKLRIAWSVGWGVMCLLLIALWVRSYKSADVLTFPVTSIQLLGFGSIQGGMTAHKGEYLPGYYRGYWEIRRDPILDPRIVDYRAQARPEYRGALGFGLIRSPPFTVVCAPHWFFVGLTVIFAVLSWTKFCWKFSLRTLLIATTVIAAVLGMIVWM